MFDPAPREPLVYNQSGNNVHLALYVAAETLGGRAMNKFFAQLRPLERRLAVGVLVVFILVLNWVFIWPHFSDWSNLRHRIADARQKLAVVSDDHRGNVPLRGVGEEL